MSGSFLRSGIEFMVEGGVQKGGIIILFDLLLYMFETKSFKNEYKLYAIHVLALF